LGTWGKKLLPGVLRDRNKNPLPLKNFKSKRQEISQDLV
jgi:hypothetical protein